jgi:methyltransferase (TIGR00027 family)
VRSAASHTAELVCLARALEAERPAGDRIVDDPLATRFLGPLTSVAALARRVAAPLGPALDLLEPAVATYVLARHRCLDAWLEGALAAGAAQAVILGAGYDTRAFRLADALAGRPLWEVDFPATANRKRARLDALSAELPRVDRRVVPLDFRADDLERTLREAGFDAGRPTCWVWEGVSMYLSRSAVKATLAALGRMSAPGSSLLVDWWFLPDSEDLAGTAHRLAPGLLHLLGEPLTFSMHPDDLADFLSRQGLRLEEGVGAAELERRWVRDGRRVYPACHVTRASLGGAAR